MSFIEEHRFAGGMHRGRRLTDPAVPPPYIKWALEYADLTRFERCALLGELRRRGVPYSGPRSLCAEQRNHGSGSPVAGSSSGDGNGGALQLPPSVDPRVLLLLVIEGQRGLARRLHPDVGGDAEAMTAVNNAAAVLEADLYRMIGPGSVPGPFPSAAAQNGGRA